MTLGTSTAELDFMLKDAGVLAIFGSYRAYGILHRDAIPTLTPDTNFALPFYQKTLRIRPGTLGPIRTESALTVDGGAFVVRNVGEVEDDGLVPITITEAV